MRIALLVLRWSLRLFFVITALALIAGLMAWSFVLWDQWSPGIVDKADAGAARGRYGSGLALLIAAPLPLLGFHIWFRYFDWIDQMFDAEKGPLADAPAAVKAYSVNPRKAGICIYRKKDLFPAATAPVLLDQVLAGTISAKDHVFREVDPGTHVITAQKGKEATLCVDAKAGSTYYIWHQAKMGLFESRSHLHLVDEAAGMAAIEKGRLGRSLMIAATALAALAATVAALYQLGLVAGNDRKGAQQQVKAMPKSQWLTADQYQQEFNTWARRGLYPQAVEGRCETGGEKYRADWKAVPPGASFFSYFGMTREGYDRRNQEYGVQGYSLASLKQFSDCSGIDRYQATWVKR